MPFEILKRASIPSFDLPDDQIPPIGDKPGIFPSANGFKGRSRSRRDSSLRALRIKKTPTQSGFLFTVDLPDGDTGKDSAEASNDDDKSSPDLNGKEAARGQRFANIFINSAKNISAKYNVLDKPEAIDNSDSVKLSSQKKIRVSRASRNRAELVKATFEMKYHCIVMCLEVSDSENLHPGVEGVFNPLQVIRNRIVRQKLEHHSPSTYRTLPLACNAFSSHSSGAKSWSMVWGIELNDFVADFGWRQIHWNLLRNSKGELWYPDKSSKHTKSKNSLTNLLDKLWDDKDTDSLLKAEDIILEVPIMTRRKKTRATKRIRNNIKDKAKRFYGSGSAGSSILDQDWTAENSSATNHRLSSLESLSRVKIDRVGRRLSNDASSQSQGLSRRRSSEGYGTFSSEGEPSSEADQKRVVPKIIVNDIYSSPVQNAREQTIHSPLLNSEDPLTKHLPELGSINDVSFSQVHLQRSPVLNLDNLEDEEEIENANHEEMVEKGIPEKARQYDCLALLNNEERFLEGVTFVSSYYLESVYPKLLESAEKNTAKLHDTVIKGLLHSAVRINDEYLPAQENLYRAFLDEANTLIHLSNDKHAVRIDNLLTATDRSYNELNTTLLMDLKKVGEQLDKLNLKFFGNSVTTVLKDAQGNVLTNALQYATLYFILENLIVVVLRLVWIVANISKVFWIFSKSIFFVISSIWRFFS